ncbi:hypothetical protein [Collinsella vaginalis]|uniref:hypothetical protein n=1 Tax=Collinsella vaginalis TaxID=1870987 RepID=UPI001C4FBBD7|nr:hypothetical protein [Collinsella vaginalis]
MSFTGPEASPSRPRGQKPRIHSLAINPYSHSSEYRPVVCRLEAQGVNEGIAGEREQNDKEKASVPTRDESRRAFNPTAAEDKILRHLERIDNRTRKYLQAKDYMAWFNPAWQALSDEERDVLEVCFLSGYESATDAICEVQERLNVERSTAYNRRKTGLSGHAVVCIPDWRRTPR